MNYPLFIFQPGLWVGEGKIRFSNSQEELRFFTKWTISDEIDQKIHAFQQVEMECAPEQVRNHFLFSDMTETSFSIQLENEAMGIVSGSGIITPSTISWVFKEEDFEGSESYSLVPDKEEYLLNAEYVHDDFLTMVEGRIWKKSM